MNLLKIFSLILLTGMLLMSCGKKDFKSGKGLGSEIANETESLRLATTDYEIVEVEALGNVEDEVYTAGVLEYSKNGEVLAVVKFGEGSDSDKAVLIKDGEESEIALKKQGGSGKEKFEKVIVEPLVKADDCNYEIVSGIIKYYDLESGEWLATVDFGDGTCDDIAEKDTEKGTYVFTVSDYF